MHSNYVEKDAFNIENDHLEFLIMLFWFKNALCTFKRGMHDILRVIQNANCLVYLYYCTKVTDYLISQNIDSVPKRKKSEDLLKSDTLNNFGAPMTNINSYLLISVYICVFYLFANIYASSSSPCNYWILVVIKCMSYKRTDLYSMHLKLTSESDEEE